MILSTSEAKLDLCGTLGTAFEYNKNLTEIWSYQNKIIRSNAKQKLSFPKLLTRSFLYKKQCRLGLPIF